MLHDFVIYSEIFTFLHLAYAVDFSGTPGPQISIKTTFINIGHVWLTRIAACVMCQSNAGEGLYNSL
jgi:hypothetical protein